MIIIGSGPGGYRAAEYAARNGLQVIVFEGAQAGGTCLNCGCIPTKTLLHESQQPDRDYTKAREHKDAVVEQLRTGVEQLMAQPGITLVRGWASFKDDHTVVCDGEEYEADNIIIATGSKAKLPPIEGLTLTPDINSVPERINSVPERINSVPERINSVPADLQSAGPRIVTSTGLLDLDHVPRRLVIIGAGVIGMEFASVFSAFGSEVTVVEFLKECLPAMDSDIAKRLRKSMEKRGVSFHMQAAVKRIAPEGVTFERKGKEETIAADVVLIATGRSPRIDGLNLDAAGIPHDRQGITVDPQTLAVSSLSGSVRKGLYAIGDVNGLSLLAHAATMQGLHVVNHILGRADNIRLDIMPAAVFTTPEAASVGKTEDQLKEQGVTFTCKKGLYRANGKALAMDETEGILKLLADEDGHILGCHVLGAHAADIVQEVAALMNLNATVGQLRDIIHIHPTLGEILHDTAEMF